MASVKLQPLQPFNFQSPDEWPRWHRRFDQFRLASGLSAEDKGRQVCTLLYCMGETAEDVLSSTDITDDEKKDYNAVIKKFDAFFKVRKNVIFERARFNSRCQKEGETTEQFITSLYQLIEDCDYGDLKDQMIRDRIVVGIRDKALSQRLQMDSELTLEKAKTLSRQREAIQEQQVLLNSTSTTREIDFVRRGKGPAKKSQTRKSPNTSTSRSPYNKSMCTRCGRGPHSRQQCPANSVECHKCKIKGHFSSQCFSKTVAAVASQHHETQHDTDDLAYLSTIDSDSSHTWTTKIEINGCNAIFKVDTGAEVTVITEDTVNSLDVKELRAPSKTLHGPDNKPLDVCGEFQARLIRKDYECIQPVFVVKNVKHNLLGLPAIRALHLLSTVDTIEQTIHQEFSSLFTGLGTLKGDPYKIQLSPNAQPFALFTPRNVPLPLRAQVKDELARMETLGVITPVEEPTTWCAGMVVVPKKSGSVRIRVDYRPLNNNILREVHPLPTVDENLAQLAGAKFFTKLDANSGFWQIPLSPDSCPLTTFITPFGRYMFNKLPFGISSAPEHFQKKMQRILAGQEGTICHMDDVLIHGRTQQEHDVRLRATLKLIEAAGLTLNPDKCEFSKDTITFLGHIINQDGISPDPRKTLAVQEMEQPRTVTELRRFLGMVNQLGKFSAKLADLSQPLRELLSNKKAWIWGPAQESAFTSIKSELANAPTLAPYSLSAPTTISADASAYGLGAVVLQKQPSSDRWKPVAFASRSLTETEKRYSQIEKEALALVWACERFSTYVIGKPIMLETDHKPLVPLLGKTNLDCLPPRVLRFRIRLMRFHYNIVHVPGKSLNTADALSRAPTTVPDDTQVLTSEQTEVFVNNIISSLPANSDRLNVYRNTQQQDIICSRIIAFCTNGWPRKEHTPADLMPYWQVKSELTICDNLLLRGNRIVVPHSLQKETMDKIHSGHQGIQRCLLRVTSSVWWPHIRHQMEQLIQNCPVCTQFSTPQRQPMSPSELPKHPWQKVATDFFHLNGKTYLLVADYFSRYLEVQHMATTTAASTIRTLKAIFARHGIPAQLISDNGPQYSSDEMVTFAKEYNFTHITSSPNYPQSNGFAERMVQTAKILLKKTPDPYLALLSYRSTPLPWCGLSPSQLLMGRQLRSNVPQVEKSFIPEWSYLPTFREKDRDRRQKQKSDYDRRHRVKDLAPLLPDKPIWVHTHNRTEPGQVIRPARTPRSYIVQTPSGQLRRTQSHITPRPVGMDSNNGSTENNNNDNRHIITRSQSGASVGPPSRLTYWRKGDVVYT